MQDDIISIEVELPEWLYREAVALADADRATSINQLITEALGLRIAAERFQRYSFEDEYENADQQLEQQRQWLEVVAIAP